MALPMGEPAGNLPVLPDEMGMGMEGERGPGEACGNCQYWEGGPGGPVGMENMGVCRIITDGDPEAMTMDGDQFLCADTFYCSLYEAGGEDYGGESMGGGLQESRGPAETGGGPPGGPTGGYGY